MQYLVLLLAVTVGIVAGADICTENVEPLSNPALLVPNVFTTDIEVVSQERSNVQNIKMTYSKPNGIIRLGIIDSQINSDYYFYFKDDEILAFDYTQGRGTCKVSQLSTSLDNFLVGGIKPGKTNIPNPLAALHFTGNSGFGSNQIVLKKLPQETIREKKADVYQSCQKWTTKGGKNNIVLSVKHYFAADTWTFPGVNTWASDVGDKRMSILMAITVEGTGKVMGQNNVHIKHTYSYFNFKQGGITPSKQLETPDGIVCPKRKLDKKFPTLTPFIRVTSETIDYLNGRYFIQDEIYDVQNSLAIFRQPLQPNSKDDLTRLVTLLDMKSGIKYAMDAKLKLCKQSFLNATTNPEYPVYSLLKGKVSMFTPKQFFRADGNDFAYLGPKKIRGMLADSWVAQSKDFKGSPNAVVQWYFAPPVTSWNDGNPVYREKKWPMPVKFSFWSDATGDITLTTNLFHVDYNPVRPDFVDTSGCFINTQHFQLIIKGSKQDLRYTDFDAFKFNTISQIGNVGQVQHAQINQMKMYYIKDDVVLTFVIGSNSDLTQITQRVVKGVKSGVIKFNLIDPKTKLFSKTIPIDRILTESVFDESNFFGETTVGDKTLPPLKRVISGESGYGNGAMAGLGVAMCIVGIAGGAVAGYGHSRYMGTI